MLNIIATAVADGRFTTLMNTIAHAGLVDTLSGSGPFILFAPTDQAFATVPAQTVLEWRQPDQLATLTEVLTLHVAADYPLMISLQPGQLIRTVHGQPLTVDQRDGLLTLNGFTVAPIALRASNGTIYALTGVLIPD